MADIADRMGIRQNYLYRVTQELKKDRQISRRDGVSPEVTGGKVGRGLTTPANSLQIGAIVNRSGVSQEALGG